MKKKLPWLVFTAIFIFIGVGVYSNIKQQMANDRSKLPEKIESSKYFQRWITNLRNKGIELEADNFSLKDEVEIYNTKWMKVYSYDDTDKRSWYDKTLNDYKSLNDQNTKGIVFSPSDREILDYRMVPKGEYKLEEARFFGLKDTKILDTRVVSCPLEANCYFDRGYFLSNDLFVVTEISRNITKTEINMNPCAIRDTCTYTFKLHLIDMINNRRSIYESQAFEVVLNELIPNL